VATKRGINLGCGTVIMPCPRPKHHRLIPEWLYTDPDIAWDNADWNALPGVNKVLDLFDYPWHDLETGVYDYAVASHIVEHIPHHIVWEGQFTPRHPEYQDGWFAWFSELRRIMKPGGEVWLLAPYGFSNSGVSDPTHTRYITLATFGYFSGPGPDTPFLYRSNGQWEIDIERDIWWMAHEDMLRDLRLRFAAIMEPAEEDVEPFYARAVYQASLSRLNAIVELCIRMVAKDDANPG